MKKIILLFLFVFPASIIIACSASGMGDSAVSEIFKGTRMLPDGVSRIYVEETSDGSVDRTAKETFDIVLRRRININQQLSLTGTPANSDLMLKVFLTGFSSQPLKYNISGDAVLKKVSLDAYVDLIYIPTGEEKIRNKLVRSEYLYSDRNPPIMSDYNAIKALADILAERVISVVTTGFYEEKSR